MMPQPTCVGSGVKSEATMQEVPRSVVLLHCKGVEVSFWEAGALWLAERIMNWFPLQT